MGIHKNNFRRIPMGAGASSQDAKNGLGPTEMAINMSASNMTAIKPTLVSNGPTKSSGAGNRTRRLTAWVHHTHRELPHDIAPIKTDQRYDGARSRATEDFGVCTSVADGWRARRQSILNSRRPSVPETASVHRFLVDSLRQVSMERASSLAAAEP